VELTKDNYIIKHTDHDNEIIKQTKEIEYSLEQIEKGNYKHFMLKEIFEQPISIMESIRGRIDKDNKVNLGGIYDWTHEIISKKYIYLTACGTSWHAAQIGSYILESILRRPVKVEYASEFRYRNKHIDSDSLLIAISQSGETADTLAAIKKAKEYGALTLGVVNVVGSSIARETDCGVYMHAGPEIGVASTKAFTSQVVTLSLLGNFIGQHLGIKESRNILSDIKKLPNIIKNLLKLSDKILDISKSYVKSENFLYLGRGYQFPVALEGALKLKEISYIHSEGYPAAEMKHGPIALIDDKMPVVVIVTKKGYDKILSNIQEVKSRGGKLIIITTIDSEDLRKLATDFLYLEGATDLHNSLTPILTSIPLQLLSYHIATLKGCNVDQPRNLAKSVTVE
jgi:glucosamine--fructose-6-phosphate aminotransferase (isomerizing)